MEFNLSVLHEVKVCAPAVAALLLVLAKVRHRVLLQVQVDDGAFDDEVLLASLYDHAVVLIDEIFTAKIGSMNNV